MDKDITYLEEKILEKNKLINDLNTLISEREDRIVELEEALWNIKEITLKKY